MSRDTVSSDLVVAGIFALKAAGCLAFTSLVALRRIAVTARVSSS